MKVCLMIATCCVALLFSTAETYAQKLDITLEGPWILYEDHNLFQGETVLVALAPSVADQTKPHVFHHPTVSSGDGYIITQNGVYCLMFSTVCGRTGPGKLTSTGYAPPVPLYVKVKTPSAWNWEAPNQQHSGTALILPMPDLGYSNDGIWPMRFGMQFDLSGNGYAEVGGPKHSIGVQLHYNSAPAVLDLKQCGTNPTVDNCKFPVPVDHTQLENTGTLSMVMKAPEDADICDLHVRTVYPQMLALLDDPNQAIAYIDPARGMNSTFNGVYTEPTGINCLLEDPQGNGGGSNANSQAVNEIPALKLQITDIAKGLRELQKSKDLTADQKTFLLLSGTADELDAEAASLNNWLPRLSQLTRIKQVLLSSSSLFDTLRTQLSAANKIKVPFEDLNRENQLVATLLAFETAEKVAADGIPTKDGKDCRAPIMLVKQ